MNQCFGKTRCIIMMCVVLAFHFFWWFKHCIWCFFFFQNSFIGDISWWTKSFTRWSSEDPVKWNMGHPPNINTKNHSYINYKFPRFVHQFVSLVDSPFRIQPWTVKALSIAQSQEQKHHYRDEADVRSTDGVFFWNTQKLWRMWKGQNPSTDEMNLGWFSLSLSISIYIYIHTVYNIVYRIFVYITPPCKLTWPLKEAFSNPYSAQVKTEFQAKYTVMKVDG